LNDAHSGATRSADRLARSHFKTLYNGLILQ
jgi:hypothetical protein